MNKFFSLLRASMSGGVQLFNYQGKTARSRRAMPIVLAFVIGITMFLSSTTIMQSLKEDSAEVAILAFYTLATSIIIISEGVYKSGDLLFKTKDNDMLLAMPIQKSTIIATRIVRFYAFEMLYCLIFLLPAIIAYAANTETSPSFYFVSLVMLVLTPIIPIAISCIIGLISSAISARFKRRTLPRVFTSLLALFILAAIMIFTSSKPHFDDYLASIASSNISKFYYPAATFSSLVKDFNLLQFILFITINLVVLAATVFIVSHFYYRVSTHINTVKEPQTKNANFNTKNHSQTYAIARKEITKYFCTPVLLTNTAIGLVLFLVVVGAICFKSDELMTLLTSSFENFPLTSSEISSYMPSLNFALVAFTSLMTFITATTISLEGKEFNLLKTMPVSGKKVILAKVLAAMILIVPVTMLGSLVLLFRFHYGIIDALLVFIGIVFLPLVTELVGVLVDLKYANFDAQSEAAIVRQSPGVMVATFMGLGMVLLTISFTFAVVFVAGQTVGLLMMDAIFVVMSAFLLLAVVTHGEERYDRLSA